ncbi:hypothetical protein GBF38_022158 [Nibea albiflora]|uniref:Uncharacterized protein n=1 Tax=Nibea albiflora TaxID=240163 RepID=A0ACB7FHD9_NIBAL|nr:hypothetical protein GBF38_022158 [Nibea albiflora]
MSKVPWKTTDTRASSRASPEANAVTSTAVLDRGPGHDAILQAIAELRSELLSKAETQSAEIRNQVDQLRAVLKLANDNANARSEALDKRVVALESAADSHSDRIATLERDMANVRTEVATQKARSEDLEARSRRNNLRITGIKERREDGKRVMKQLTMGDGDKIRIQPDYTQAVAKQRAEFNEVRGLLRTCEGIRYGLWYPAEMRITTSDGVHTSFKDPKQARDFIMKNLKH